VPRVFHIKLFSLEEFFCKQDFVRPWKEDPTGFSLIDKKLEEHHQYYGENKPPVIGYEKGARRYKELYNTLIAAGVNPDKE